MKIRTLIVDDEPLARERLRTLLAREEDVEIVAECGDGREAVHAIEEQAPDLVFLDVQMPEMDGFEVLQAIDPGRMPVVVFVTAYDQYALRAFEVHALDYLLKPFDRQRFTRSLSRARGELARERGGGLSRRLLALIADLGSQRRYLERLVIRDGGRVFFLRTEEVDWMEAAGNYVRLHVAGRSHLIRETLTRLEDKLDPERFLRIHRSRIVNLERIRELQPWFHGEYVVILRDGKRLTTSRSYNEKVQQLLENSP